MENNKKIRELYEIYLELGHDVFEEKIKKHMENYLHDGSNVITINYLNTIIAIALEKFKLGEAVVDECDIFTPTITNETVYACVESNITVMLMDHDNNALCDSYIVDFIHDAAENYFERGKYGYRNLHVTKLF